MLRDGLGVRRALHRRRLMRQGYDRTRTWRVRKSGGYVALLVLTFLGALLLLFHAITAIIILPQEKSFESPVRWVDKQCTRDGDGFGCAVLQSLFMPFLTLALATVTYLFFRFTHVRRAYLRKARPEPHALVETAGGIFGRVVAHLVELGEAFCRAQSTLLSRSPFRPKGLLAAPHEHHGAAEVLGVDGASGAARFEGAVRGRGMARRSPVRNGARETSPAPRPGLRGPCRSCGTRRRAAAARPAR